MDVTLTAEQQSWQQVARDFVQREIKPTVLERDRIDDPLARMPWDWVREASRLGLRTLPFPKEAGGGGANIVTLCIVGEELAAGDLGFAVILDQVWKFVYLFTEAMTPTQYNRFLPPFMADPEALTCIAITEPNLGSDHQGYYDSPTVDFRTVAVRDGDSYVLNGHKQFPSNACVAKLYFVGARTDPQKSLREGGSSFVITSDTPGFIPGRTWDKIGQRLCINGSFSLENCRIPADNILLGEGRMMDVRSTYVPGSKPEAAATTLGVGRAAFEDALALTKARLAGPLGERQALAMMLADMAMNLEATRRLIWRAAWLADRRDREAGVAGLQSKVFSSQVAFDVCRQALEVAGERGLQADYPFGKYLRDASTFFHSDGTNQLALLRVARALAGRQPVVAHAGF